MARVKVWFLETRAKITYQSTNQTQANPGDQSFTRKKRKFKHRQDLYLIKVNVRKQTFKYRRDHIQATISRLQG